jgi:uncharacterized protein YbjT (DUF2867 family)
MKILVTGSTGYIGSNLVPALVARGYQVRLLVRDASRVNPSFSNLSLEYVQGTLEDTNALREALRDVTVAYYLVHSMQKGADFHQTDIRLAGKFAELARESNVGRVVYLGALGNPDSKLTEHLKSRHETGEILASTGVNVLEFRSGPVIGSGSMPFEMIRYLTERLPVMICPKWIKTNVQPIGLKDILLYLVSSASIKKTGHCIIEVGGSDILSYGEMMTKYARIRKLHRFMIHVPVLTPRLSSKWVHLVTPLKSNFARPLVEGLKNEIVVRNNEAHRLFPDVSPRSYAESVQLAVKMLHPSAMNNVTANVVKGYKKDTQGMIIEHRVTTIDASIDAVYRAFTSLGGANGWYFNFAWQVRGALDRLIGGPGLRRKNGASPIKEKQNLDFWHVESLREPNRMLLKADMKLPGSAWIEFRAEKDERSERTKFSQITYFAPHGLMGYLYWWTLLPIHRFIFDRLITKVAKASQAH